MNEPERVVLRAITKYDVDAAGCWISRYSVGSHGYAQIGWSDDGRTRMRLVHRIAWEAVNGPITDGLTVDHLCKVKRCMNVAHMRLLTPFDNSRRGDRDWPLGQCVNGHSDEWMAPVKGQSYRQCMVCFRESRRRSAAKRRARLKAEEAS